MTSCSILVVARKHTIYAVAGLIGVVVTQALGYGLIFDLNFFLRNLSVMGGLLMVLSESWVRKKFAPAGLPQIDEKDRKMYVQLAGRVLLIFLFIGFVFAGEWNFSRVLVSILGFVACVMAVIGFKAKLSAILLVLILSIFNLVGRYSPFSAILNGSIRWGPLLNDNRADRFASESTPSGPSTHTTHTRTSRNTTSSRSYLSCKSRSLEALCLALMKQQGRSCPTS